MADTVSPTVFICATHWSFSLRHFPRPTKGDFFFFFWSCLQSLLLICFSWAVDLSLQMQMVWAGLWGHTFAPCPFDFNPGSAMAGAGREGGSSTAPGVRLQTLDFSGTQHGGTKASRMAWVWWQLGRRAAGQPRSAGCRYAKPEWEFCYHFLRKSLNQGLTL